MRGTNQSTAVQKAEPQRMAAWAASRIVGSTALPADYRQLVGNLSASFILSKTT
jgi:hypothetical protein